ncbi:MAG: hypothetical protein J5716_09710, partial [Alphaproteobacteria bacterium]|nr:hypothetical protein [Alphaproteobacteria bacterium]
MRLTVLYPFMEKSFSESTPAFIEKLAWLQKSRAIDLLITVDQPGKTADALKKAKLSYEEVAFLSPIGLYDFYLVVLYKLIRSALPSFFYFNSHKIDLVHCPDLLSLLCWGNTAKMNRIPFITSLQSAEKISHYSSLMLTDSKKIICCSEDIRSKIPERFSSRALLAPEAQNISEN